MIKFPRKFLLLINSACSLITLSHFMKTFKTIASFVDAQVADAFATEHMGLLYLAVFAALPPRHPLGKVPVVIF